MGVPKQLLPWGKTVMLQRVIDAALASRLGTILLVLGYRADEIAGRIRVSSRTRILVNRNFRAGMSSSVQCAIVNAPADAEAFMLLLGDQPLIGTGVVNRLIDCYHAGRRGIVIPVYNGKRGHPVLFDSRYRRELLLVSDQGPREVVSKHDSDILEIRVDTPSVLIDIDTPQDYQEAKAQGGEWQ